MIIIKDFDPNLLKIDKKLYININIYYIGYITVKLKKINGKPVHNDEYIETKKKIYNNRL